MKAYCKRLKFCAPSPPLALASLRGGISHVAGAVPSRSSSRFGAALARAAALAGSVELRADLCAAHRDLLCAVGSCSVAGGPVWLVAGGVLWMSVSVALLSPLSVSLPLSP